MMEEWLLILNQPLILWSLFGGAIGLILIDYLFPVDWPAYFGYALFGIFVGATIPLSGVLSFLAMAVVFVLMLILHKAIFSRYLTNAPKHELARRQRVPIVNENQDSNEEGADYVAR